MTSTPAVLFRSLAFLLLAGLATAATAQNTIPTTSPVFGDDFESTLENWFVPSGHTPTVGGSSGRSGTGGLEIPVSSSENHVVRGNRREVARADEAYLTFWLDPNSVSISSTSGFIPTRSLRVAAIQGPGRDTMVALRIYDTGSGYEGYLEWYDGSSNQFDFSSGSFAISDSYQEITLGFRTDGWVSCWIGGVLQRTVSVDHGEPYGAILEVGKTNFASAVSPSGTLLFDDVSLALPRISDLWVDAGSGDDSFDGKSPGTPFATISRASDLAAAGTVVHIEPGVYREAVIPAQGGASGDPVIYRAEDGPGTVSLRGSEPSSSLGWTQMSSDTIGLPAGVDPQKIWWADLSSWTELDDDDDGTLSPPRYIVLLDGAGDVMERLPASREPDWTVPDQDKYSSRWWRADGGSSAAACDPTVEGQDECDLPSRSATQLTDTSDDGGSIEAGHLGSLGDLTGAHLRARECYWGHRLCVREIVSHSVGSGQVTVDTACNESDGDPGLGWGSEYYLEHHPGLLDTPGEWWFDDATDRLYLWPPESSDPAGQLLEISRHSVGFDLKDRSYVSIEDLDVELYNGALIENQNFGWHDSVGNTVSGCNLRYGSIGLLFSQTVEDAGSHEDKRIEGTHVEGNTIAFMDDLGFRIISLWGNGSDPDSWHRSGVFDTTLLNNTIHDIGFRASLGSTGALASSMAWTGDGLQIVGNSFSDTAQENLMLFRSVIQSTSTFDFSDSEIKTGEILVQDNIFESGCQLKNDCGSLMVHGVAPDEHVFRDLLITGNTARGTIGWSYASESRGLWDGAQVTGGGGMGLYIGGSSNVHVYRNSFYDNAFAGIHMAKTWRDGKIHIFNNVGAGNAFGLHAGGLEQDLHDDVDTRILNNIFVNNRVHGIQLSNKETTYPNLQVDHNLYWQNGWGDDVFKPGVMRIVHDPDPNEHQQTISAVQANTPFESSGQSADPLFFDYSFADHDLFDGSKPDFRITVGSPAVDAGTASLSTSLSALLSLHGVSDSKVGSAFDQGAFEGTVSCDDLVLANMIVSTSQNYEACGEVTLGPSFEVKSPAEVTVTGRRGVRLESGVSVEIGSSLELRSN